MSFNDGKYVLFAAQATDANGTAQEWFGGSGVFAAWGTFGGGTCKLQYSPDAGVTWVDVDRDGDDFVTFSANGIGGFELPKGYLRAVLAGSSAASVSADVSGSGQ